MAAGLMTSILVPSLSVMRDAMAKSRDLHRRSLLANYAVRVVEDECASASGNWVVEKKSGSFVSEGHANIRYTLKKTDSALEGGLPNRLMHIQVTVFDDADADTVLDAGELQVFYRTKVARLNAYENAN